MKTLFKRIMLLVVLLLPTSVFALEKNDSILASKRLMLKMEYNFSYALENLIDTSRFDYVVQDSSMPVHVSLAAMAECKHFVIGNTTFGWWAQYLSENEDRIVVAPSKWMAIDMPIDIYQDGWKLIEV